jgi:hypothetical protein
MKNITWEQINKTLMSQNFTPVKIARVLVAIKRKDSYSWDELNTALVSLGHSNLVCSNILYALHKEIKTIN